jgi:hypothetical protein
LGNNPTRIFDELLEDSAPRMAIHVHAPVVDAMVCCRFV